MKQIAIAVLALVGAAALAAGGVYLWSNRPGRVAVSVNGRVLTERELDWRAETLLEDAKRVDGLLVPEKNMAEAMRHFRRLAAKMWIVKEVLLAAAVEAGIKATPEDEKESLERAKEQLKSRNLTFEQFLAEGPIPAEVKMADMREAVLIGKYTKQESARDAKLMEKDIQARIAELKAMNTANAGKEGYVAAKTDRRSVIAMLQQEKYNEDFRNLFRERFGKMEVKCPAFPSLETVDGVSPARQ